MSVVNIASSRTLPETDHLAELAVSLSSRLTRVPADGMPSAIAESLAEIASAIRVEGCRLLEFGDLATVSISTWASGSEVTERRFPAPEPGGLAGRNACAAGRSCR